MNEESAEIHEMKRGGIMGTEVPLWIVLVVFVVLLAMAGTLFYFYRSVTYNYGITLPSSGTQGGVTLAYGPQPVLSNATFFQDVKEQFIVEKATFIEADLSDMKIRVYKNGQPVKEVKILTKGREGSWWETPAGLYKIESKSSNHFSSFGSVYQPWSMAFQGNFFIHGWPYYPDGTPVASTYSGGCIRLSDEDAKAIYDLISVGTPVLVFESSFDSDEFSYGIRTPDISATQYLVADLKNNYVFLEKGIKNVAPIASVTKIVTALVAAEYINLEKEIEIKESMLASTSKPRLKVGQKVNVFNLLYPLMLESSNEAAEAIARSLGRDRFIKLMNDKARSLGLSSTRFVDPAGREEGNTSTPEDLFALAKYVYNNRSFVFKMSTGNLNHTAYGSPIFTGLGNYNIVPGTSVPFVGGKVGMTGVAGETMLSVFEVTIHGEKRPVVIILLNSKDRNRDAAVILSHIREMYER